MTSQVLRRESLARRAALFLVLVHLSPRSVGGSLFFLFLRGSRDQAAICSQHCAQKTGLLTLILFSLGPFRHGRGGLRGSALEAIPTLPPPVFLPIRRKETAILLGRPDPS